jgi:hypothetical protein
MLDGIFSPKNKRLNICGWKTGRREGEALLDVHVLRVVTAHVFELRYDDDDVHLYSAGIHSTNSHCA